jgi:hypothetical protein
VRRGGTRASAAPRPSGRDAKPNARVHLALEEDCMSKRLVPVAVCLLALAVPSLAQRRFEATPPAMSVAKVARVPNPFAGRWTYRSYQGTVVRTKPHGSAKAGYVASFIAAKQP